MKKKIYLSIASFFCLALASGLVYSEGGGGGGEEENCCGYGAVWKYCYSLNHLSSSDL